MNIVHEDFDLISYKDAMVRQSELHQQVKSGEIDAAIMTLQHPPTLTLGKHASLDNFLMDPKQIEMQGVEIIESERGGEVTAHMPGQLVVYPILPLRELGLGAKTYVNEVLLGSVMKTLENYGISTYTDDDKPGVWVDDKKICAVGVRISQRISTHGIAININNSLSVFEYIVPCGIKSRGVTSIAQELGKSVGFERVKESLLLNIYKSIGNLTSDA